MITLRFACGHGVTLGDDIKDTPVCVTCGEHRVSRVTAPAPRFVGVCQGPHATEQPLGGIPIAIPKDVNHAG